MRAGGSLELPEPLSPRLLSAMPRIQDIYHAWDLGRFKRIEVKARPRSEQPERASGVGCLFSGGLDSFYTLLKHRDEVTHVIFADGYDIRCKTRRAGSGPSMRQGRWLTSWASP